jgi:hypothetical protein
MFMDDPIKCRSIQNDAARSGAIVRPAQAPQALAAEVLLKQES